LDEKEISIGLFLNLSKAFDLVDHDILLRKMARLGIQGVALKWFQTYLENREQAVEVTYRCKETNKIINCLVYPERDPSAMASHKVLFWDQCCFCYT
jgi:hypothetical protein